MSDIKLNDEQIKELEKCFKNGRLYIAKDRDGNCYAYKLEPEKNGRRGFWKDEYSSYRLDEDYEFLLWEDIEPFYIGDLFEVVYKGNK